MSVPSWLEDGGHYGEHGLALELDRCMVAVANMRQRAYDLFVAYSNLLEPCEQKYMQSFCRLLAEAQEVDDNLAVWAKNLPAGNRYSIHTLEVHANDGKSNRIFDATIHTYPTLGHAAMWNRYRALRLAVHDIMDKALYVLSGTSGFDADSLSVVTKFFMQRLADDLCASVPYMLDLLEIDRKSGHDITVTAKAQMSSLKGTVKATTASFLCWPLVMATGVSALPEKHLRYLSDRLLDVSELVDDGVLEKVAMSGSSISRGSRGVP